jgi:hypothetical protein
LSVGGATPTTSGTGITFPATQSASSNANTLDDYEEGSFTISLTPSISGSITLNSSYTTVGYTKIGRVVTITGNPRIDSVSSPVGSIVITLPFPVWNGNTSDARAGNTVTYYDNSAVSQYFFSIPAYATENTSSLYIFVNYLNPVAITPAAGDELVLSFTYFTNT